MRRHSQFVWGKLYLATYLICVQVIEKRKVQNPDRPLIRISSTFFWHLSSDYDLVPIPSLAARGQAISAEQIRLGYDDDTIYEPMKVGKQVQK